MQGEPDLKLREKIATRPWMGVRVKHRHKNGDKSRLTTDLIIPGGVNQIDFCDHLTLHDLIEAVPPYELSHDSFAEVLEKMPSAIQWSFADHLRAIVIEEARDTTTVIWLLVTASPSQKCRAVLRAAGVEVK